MTKRLLHVVECLAIVGCIIGSQAPNEAEAADYSAIETIKAAEYRTIVVQPAQVINIPLHPPKGGSVYFSKMPEGQSVSNSSSATFSVTAARTPGHTPDGITYQWQKNPIQLNGELYWTNMPGETNLTLKISNAQLSDVGYYRAIATWGSATNASDPAPLVVCFEGSILAVGTPVASGAGNQWCTTHAGYVLYPNAHNSHGGSGWIVVNAGLDGSALDVMSPSPSTKNEADGNQYGEGYCGTPPGSANGFVKVPHQILSTTWGFTIWFPSNPVPTGYYTNKLTNFIP